MGRKPGAQFGTFKFEMSIRNPFGDMTLELKGEDQARVMTESWWHIDSTVS